MGVEDVLDPLGKKQFYNIMMILTILSTWNRFVSILFVIKSVSKLLMTIFKMLSSAVTFLFILMGYMLIANMVALTLFQESLISHSSGIFSIRTLFDAMQANYSYEISSEYEYVYTGFLFIHIFFSNVFMLNYLVAILSTVYEDMMNMGDFAFKCNKYKYIERYNTAFQDQWGYNELVIHPPPINLGLIALMFSVFDKNLMQSSSKAYSLINFWLENVLFFINQLFLELCLVPFIYCKLFLNILQLDAATHEKLKMIPFWFFVGPFYLIYGVCEDIFYYFKILSDYKLDDETKILKNKEDIKQDRVVIMTEIIEIMKAIMLMVQV
jgi:hypothetical protein